MLYILPLMCFMPVDIRIADALPGCAFNIAGWAMLAAVSRRQRKSLNIDEGTQP